MMDRAGVCYPTMAHLAYILFFQVCIRKDNILYQCFFDSEMYTNWEGTTA